MTPYAALQDRVKTSPAAPLVTYRDLESGERMELSAASLDNAIAKTAGLLRDELDTEPGDVVAIHLPLHWQRVVWLGACSAVGAVFAAGADPATCAIAVVDRDHLGLLGSAREDVVVSLAPFGLPEPGGAPVGVTEAAIAMRAHPDTFVPDEPPSESAPLLLHDGQLLDSGAVMAMAAETLTRRGVGRDTRFAVIGADPMADVISLAGPLVQGGSCILVANPSAGDLSRTLRDEAVADGAGWEP